MLVSLDPDMKISDVKVLDMNETPGLGDQVLDKSFLDQFKGKTLSQVVLVKGETKENIQAISGATYSSRGVTNGVKDAVQTLVDNQSCRCTGGDEMSNDVSLGKLFKNGIFGENPVFRLALSLCPAVAVTSGVKNGFLMGVAVLFVMTMTNVTVSLLRNFINPKIRIPSYVFITATWVTVIDQVMSAYQRAVYKEMGLYIMLIVAFAIILSRAEMFASKNKLLPSFVDGVGMGVGFLLALVMLGIFREFLGKGSLWNVHILPVKPLLIMIMPTGGFFAMGLMMGWLNWIDRKFFGGAGGGGGGHH
jgi:electron transport complex protein RnfE